MIYNFNNFITEEFSKNDPIPEISRSENKLGIILLGTPGAGKSTFIREFILPRSKNFKSFSTDDVSLMFTKDPNKFHPSSSELNIERLLLFIQSGQNFIYDTTGAQDKNIFDIVNQSQKLGYDIIFIQILVDLETAKRQNLQRSRNVDEDYIDFVYSRQFQTMKDFEKLLNPKNYYIVFNKTGKYKFYKFKDGKMLKRKVDTYQPIK
jgi:predicted ABC-type ATPase